MKAIILLNGEPYAGEIKKDGVVYCCDGAYLWAKDKIEIDENLGDFDSLDITPDPLPKEIYPAEKNYTDGEIAVRRALASGASEIELYGGFGGRCDHFLGNLHLLYLAALHGVRARLIGDREIAFWGKGRVEMRNFAGKTLSIFPFGADAHIIESGGLKYPLNPLRLVYGSTRGVSNIALTDEAYVVAEGYILVIVDI